MHVTSPSNSSTPLPPINQPNLNPQTLSAYLASRDEANVSKALPDALDAAGMFQVVVVVGARALVLQHDGVIGQT